MVGIQMSCDPEKLKKVLVTSRLVMRGFYGLTEQDKEDILLDVWYRFEVDRARFPVAVYAKHCRNKVIGFLGKKTAQKRMASKIIDGVRIYLEDISLSTRVGEDDDMELADFIPADNSAFLEAELLADIERVSPDIVPAVRTLLHGGQLDRQDRRRLRSILSKETYENRI